MHTQIAVARSKTLVLVSAAKGKLRKVKSMFQQVAKGLLWQMTSGNGADRRRRKTRDHDRRLRRRIGRRSSRRTPRSSPTRSAAPPCESSILGRRPSLVWPPSPSSTFLSWSRIPSDESAYLPQLEAAGYVLRVREPDWNEHRMFRTTEKDVHVHIYSAGCPEIERNLAFRDRLRRNIDDRRRYEQTKRELAAKEWSDMNEYADAKTEVIESIIAASQA